MCKDLCIRTCSATFRTHQLRLLREIDQVLSSTLRNSFEKMSYFNQTLTGAIFDSCHSQNHQFYGDKLLSTTLLDCENQSLTKSTDYSSHSSPCSLDGKTNACNHVVDESECQNVRSVDMTFISSEEREDEISNGSIYPSMSEGDFTINDFDFNEFWNSFVSNAELPPVPRDLLMCDGERATGPISDRKTRPRSSRRDQSKPSSCGGIKSRAPIAHALAYSSYIVGSEKSSCHMCMFCSREFKRKDRLFMHMVVHTGEYPYVCQHDWCGQQFRWNSSLKRHLKMHETEEKMKVHSVWKNPLHEHKHRTEKADRKEQEAMRGEAVVAILDSIEDLPKEITNEERKRVLQE